MPGVSGNQLLCNKPPQNLVAQNNKDITSHDSMSGVDWVVLKNYK